MAVRIRTCILLLFTFVSLPPTSSAQEVKKPRGNMKLAFDGVTLRVFVEFMARISRRSLTFDPDDQNLATRKVSVISAENVPANLIWEIGLNVLSAKGYTVVPTGEGRGRFYKVVKAGTLSPAMTPVRGASQVRSLRQYDRYVTQVLPLRYVKAAAVLGDLQQALSSTGQARLVVLKNSNSILVTDYESHIRRIVRLVGLLDTADRQVATEFVSLRHTDASLIAGKIQSLERSDALEHVHLPGGKVHLGIDQRTNRIELTATASGRERIRDLIARLDVPAPRTPVYTRVYRLENSETKAILPTVDKFLATLEGKTRSSVIADAHTNLIIVKASGEHHAQLLGLLRKVDRRRPQVLINIAFAEFSPSDVLNLGVELQTLDLVSNVQTRRAFGATSFGLSALVDKAGQSVTASNPGIPVGKKAAPGVGLTSFLVKKQENTIPVILRILQTKTTTRIFSYPRLLAMDRAPAELKATIAFPVTTVNQSSATTQTTFGGFQDAGSETKITPRINLGGYVTLDIDQKLESFQGASPVQDVPPQKVSRFLRTKVTVPDGHTIILGGFSTTQDTYTVDKVPVLGDIPLLGVLFSNRTRTVSQTHIFMFIQVDILKDEKFRDLKDTSGRIRKEQDAAVKRK